jgi:hypothetical protein
MSKRPYFTIGMNSFEKNSGYKNTVFALAELIDNSFEENASEVSIILMVNRQKYLQKIVVVDNGKGMSPIRLQEAICEKSGTRLDRIDGKGTGSRKKLGKYGVGLPKASISQCNKFTVWSWTEGGYKNSYMNSINIRDRKWVTGGAIVSDSLKKHPNRKWLKTCEMIKSSSGTIVLWEDLDGITWLRARWGTNSGLIPNLAFQIGRVYREFLKGSDPIFKVKVHVIYEDWTHVEDPLQINPNDPLYLTSGCDIPKDLIAGESWPIEDPLFDLTKDDGMFVQLMMKDGSIEELPILYKCSQARRNTFMKVNGITAGNREHGKHAAKNVGISLLRENREVDLTHVLCNPSESRERWIGVQIDFPHELDEILGMTNNKQSYTRLEQVLQHKRKDYKEDDESTPKCIERIEREDYKLAICLRIAWKIQDLWDTTLKDHLNMREDVLSKSQGEFNSEQIVIDEDDNTPEGTAESIATNVDRLGNDEKKEKSDLEKLELKKKVISELKDSGVPQPEAERVAARLIDKGLMYSIISRSGLGSAFFNAREIVDAKLIEFNDEHPIHKYLTGFFDFQQSKNSEEMKIRFERAQTAIMLMLEAWVAVELEIEKGSEERQNMQIIREDWGRRLSKYVNLYEKKQGSG